LSGDVAAGPDPAAPVAPAFVSATLYVILVVIEETRNDRVSAEAELEGFDVRSRIRISCSLPAREMK
jgi:hypothetical protein